MLQPILHTLIEISFRGLSKNIWVVALIVNRFRDKRKKNVTKRNRDDFSQVGTSQISQSPVKIDVHPSPPPSRSSAAQILENSIRYPILSRIVSNFDSCGIETWNT